MMQTLDNNLFAILVISLLTLYLKSYMIYDHYLVLLIIKLILISVKSEQYLKIITRRPMLVQVWKKIF